MSFLVKGTVSQVNKQQGNYYCHLLLTTEKVHRRAEARQASERPLNVTMFFKPHALYMAMLVN